MKLAVCPGSFDPITNGHLDIIARAARLFDEVIVAVLQNSSKSYTFSVEDRVAMIRESTKDLPHVRAEAFDGLLADYARQTGATAIVKGLRAVTDFEYEFQMALLNKELSGEVETIFLTTSREYMFLSSSAVRELAAHGADITPFVPAPVAGKIRETYQKGRLS